MADSSEKATATPEVYSSSPDHSTIAEDDHTNPLSSGEVVMPTGWKYKRFFGRSYYASPQFQLVLVAFVCFLCPGKTTRGSYALGALLIHV
nr:hypothetical protein CFP56_21727 [Quercus suber]